MSEKLPFQMVFEFRLELDGTETRKRSSFTFQTSDLLCVNTFKEKSSFGGKHGHCAQTLHFTIMACVRRHAECLYAINLAAL